MSSAEKLSAELEQLAAAGGDGAEAALSSPDADIGVQLAQLRAQVRKKQGMRGFPSRSNSRFSFACLLTSHPPPLSPFQLSPLSQASDLQSQLDAAYSAAFGGLSYEKIDEESGEKVEATAPSQFTEADFLALGRADPAAARALLSAKAKAAAASEREGSPSPAASLSWPAFQTIAASLKATRSRVEGEKAALESALEGALARQRAAARRSEAAASPSSSSSAAAPTSSSRTVRPLAHGPRSLVLVAGFESFNARLYELAAADACRARPGLKVSVFCDADISGPRSVELAEALSDADAVFCSLVFDFDQVEWLKARIPERALVRLAFESALELMATTKLGTFKMDPSGRSKGPPPAVKKVLSLFGSGRVRGAVL